MSVWIPYWKVTFFFCCHSSWIRWLNVSFKSLIPASSLYFFYYLPTLSSATYVYLFYISVFILVLFTTSSLIWNSPHIVSYCVYQNKTCQFCSFQSFFDFIFIEVRRFPQQRIMENDGWPCMSPDPCYWNALGQNSSWPIWMIYNYFSGERSICDIDSCWLWIPLPMVSGHAVV